MGEPSGVAFTFDQYSTSERLKRSFSPASAATRRIYKHVQIPPDETTDWALCFPWEDREETTFQPNKVSTGRKGAIF